MCSDECCTHVYSFGYDSKKDVEDTASNKKLLTILLQITPESVHRARLTR